MGEGGAGEEGGGGEGGVDVVEGEGEEGEGREMAEGGREWTREFKVGYVNGGDDSSSRRGRRAGDASPVAWSCVFGVPVGEGEVGVIEVGLGLEEVEAFLVQGETRVEEEEEEEERKHGDEWW